MSQGLFGRDLVAAQGSNQGADPQLAAMRAGVDYSFMITLRKFTMRCRPLTIGEQTSIAGKVMAEMAKLPIGERNALAENVMQAKATLEAATTSSPGAYDPQLSQTVMDGMTPDEVQHLYKQYVQVVARANPSLELLDRQEIQSLVDALKKTSLETPGVLESALTELSFLQLVNVCRLLILSD